MFHWTPTIAHLFLPNSQNPLNYNYKFYFKVKDDYCPIPSQKSIVLSIYVLPNLIYEKPIIHGIQTKYNGDVVLKFNPVRNPRGTFYNYYIYSAFSKTGPYAIIDSIANSKSCEYTHQGARADTIKRYYFMTVSSRNTPYNLYTKIYSDTINTINLEAQNAQCHMSLSWNSPNIPSSSGASNSYLIYRKKNHLPWVKIDSTTSLTYTDNINYLGDTLLYRISLMDTIGYDSTGIPYNFESSSNPIKMILPNLTNQRNQIRCVDVLPNGGVKLTWNKFNNISNGFIYYQIFNSSDKNGVFNPIGLVTNGNTVSYIHSGSMASSKRQYYYINTMTNNCLLNATLVPSYDSASSVNINVQPPTDGKILLSWNDMRINSLSSFTNKYYIYRKNQSTPWTLIDSTNNQSYLDVSANNQTVSYKIAFVDSNSTQTPVQCVGFSSQTQAVYVGLTNNLNEDFYVYQNTPNPFDKTTTIKFRCAKNQKITFEVYNNSGKKIRSKVIAAHKGENKFKFSRKGLSAGIYYYILIHGEKSTTRKFVVE